MGAPDPTTATAPIGLSPNLPRFTNNNANPASNTETTVPFVPMITPPFSSLEVNIDLTKVLESAIKDSEVCAQGEGAWQWYLNNFEAYPWITARLEQYGFKNPLEDPEGAIKAWAQEVTKGAANDQEKFEKLVQATFKKLTFMETQTRSQEYQLPFTAKDVFRLNVADCNEFTYFFYVAAKSVGLNVGLQPELKWLQVGGGSAHLAPTIKIGTKTYKIELSNHTILEISSQRKSMPASSAFASYHIDIAAAQFGKNPDSPEVFHNFSLAQSISPEDEYANFLTGAFAFGKMQCYNQAKAIFEKVLQKNPENLLALVSLGLVYGHFGEDEKAKELFYRAIEANPQFPVPYYLVYDLESKAGNQSRAKEVLKQLISVNPMDIVAAGILGGIEVSQGNYRDFTSFYEATMTGITIEHVTTNHYLGIAYYETGEKEKAKLKLSASFRESAGMTAVSSFLLGKLALEQGNTEQALHHFNLTVMLNPNFCSGYFELAQTYKAQGKQREAQNMQKQAALCGK